MLAHPPTARWVHESQFDGVFKYVAFNGFFDWSWSLPSSAWYVPAVIPGFIDSRIRPPNDRFLAPEGGATYDAQWEAALDTGIEPQLVIITSWNEWHDGTQIEPAAERVDNGRGFQYLDYGSLGPYYYLEATRRWVSELEAMTWPGFDTGRATVTSTLGVKNA